MEGKYKPDPENPNIEYETSVDNSKLLQVSLNFISPFLNRALVPFYQFVGFLEAESGKRLYYRYEKGASLESKQNPLVNVADSIAAFKNANAHLGRDLLRLIENYGKKVEVKLENLGVNINLYRNVINADASIHEIEAFPSYLWSIIPTSTFRFLIGAASFGAIEMAASELKKDLKLLIVSPDVSYMFAQFVCKKYLSPKANAYASGIDGQGGATYRISSGVNTSGVANSKWLMGCKKWFETVHEVKNTADDAVAQAIYERRRPNGYPPRWTSLTDDQLDALENLDEFQRARWEYLKALISPRLYVQIGK